MNNMVQRGLRFLGKSALTIIIAASQSFAADFYVSPKGDDANDGLSLKKPFKTLERAKLAVRELKKDGAKKDISVELAGGIYKFERTLLFTLEDSALGGGKISYAAKSGETPVFSAGEALEFKKAKSAPKGFDAALLPKLWVADASKAVALKESAMPAYCKERDANILSLYKGFKRLDRAKSPMFMMPKATRQAFGECDYSQVPVPEKFKIIPDALNGAEVFARGAVPWTISVLAAEGWLEKGRYITCKTYATYTPMQLQTSPLRENAWIENSAQFLDADGEWIYAPADKKVYMLSDAKPEGVFAPLLIEIIKIEGEVREKEPQDIPVRGIEIKGVKFACSERFSPRKSEHLWGIQHDWDFYDRPTAAVRLRAAEDCAIEDCNFEDLGGGAIRMDLSAKNCAVKNSYFARLGGSGVLLNGYGMGLKKTMTQNLIENNYFKDCGQVFWHQPAVHVSMGFKNIVRHNTIRDFPYNGINVTGVRSAFQDVKHLDSININRYFEIDPKFKDAKGRCRIRFPDTIPYLGGENIVEFNDISRTGERMGDTNAIYISGSGLGDVARGNFLHDIRGYQANATLRTDDCQTGTLIEDNVFYNNVGLGIIIKGTNSIINNFFVESRRGNYTEKGAIGISFRGGPNIGMKVLRNIVYVCAEENPLPIQIWQLSNTGKITFKEMDVDYNLFWMAGESQEIAERQVQEFSEKYGWGKHSEIGNPRFRDIANYDFSFLSGSPAPALGIKPLDVSKAGVQGLMRKKYVLPRLESPRIVALNFERPPFEKQTLPFVDGMKVRIEVPAGAECVRYTLDGKYPDETSPKLEKPFEIEFKGPAILHVAAFAEGKEDVLGDKLTITTRVDEVLIPKKAPKAKSQ